ncbi:hypothetical protein CQA81_31695, partial [Klebsiella pneumoniae]
AGVLPLAIATGAGANSRVAIGTGIIGGTLTATLVMTSLAFIAGVLPLAIATGAGANSRVAIGTGIIGGTLTAT